MVGGWVRGRMAERCIRDAGGAAERLGMGGREWARGGCGPGAVGGMGCALGDACLLARVRRPGDGVRFGCGLGAARRCVLCT